MSGILDIREGVTWSPASNIFDAVLEQVAVELAFFDTELAAEVRGGQAANGREYLDLIAFDADEYRLFLQAAENAFTAAVWEHLKMPERGRSTARLFSFSELKALLRTDSRSSQAWRDTGRMTINPGVFWEVPGWAFDMVLEHFAVNLPTDRRAEIVRLLAARASEGTGEYDLSASDAGYFQNLLTTVDWMRLRYGEGVGYDASAPLFFTELAPCITTLHTVFHADQRAAGNVTPSSEIQNETEK